MLLRVAIAVLGLGFALGLAQRSCGYEPDPLKGLGEACTRSDECQSGLECRGGVCMTEAIEDAGISLDAGFDAGSFDAGSDAGRPDAAAVGDSGIAEDAAIDASLM